MTRGRLVVHAHFYQPFRRDPFTGVVPPDPTAAPFRDWNARIAAECYRPNAASGALRRMSWNVGPTLEAWLEDEEPRTLDVMVAADGSAQGQPAIAQAFHHAILPLSSARDRRTEIRWGLRAFQLRFGRLARAMWLPETAVDLATLGALAEHGVEATILAPWQADGEPDLRTLHRVSTGDGRAITVAFYDAALSAAVSFQPEATADADRFAHERVAPRLTAPLASGSAPTVVIATDGELYGHHQRFRDLFLARLTGAQPRPDYGFDVVDLGTALDAVPRENLPVAAIRDRTSWSCHHGVLRWSSECPDAADGRWKAPLRAAFDRLAGGLDASFEAEAGTLPGMTDPWAARDSYVDVVVGATEGDAFAAAILAPHATAADRRRLLDLLEAQRWRLAMFASDGWYWEDPDRLEPRQVMRAAARAARLAHGDQSGVELALLADLAAARTPNPDVTLADLYRAALEEIGQPVPAT